MAWLLALLVATTVALGFEPPAFDAGQAVYAEQGFSTAKTRAALAKAQRPIFVVVAPDVTATPRRPFHASHTETAVEDLWSAWSAQAAFDSEQASVILLGLDEREVRLRAGTRWDAEYGLGGPALLPLIDRAFLPWARAGDLDKALGMLVAELDAEITRLQEKQARDAQVARAMAWVPVVLLGLVVVLVPMVGLVVLFVLSRSARSRYEQAFEERWAALERGQGKLASLNLDVEIRDRVVALKIKGPRTQAAAEEVVERLSELHDGLVALEKRLKAIDREARGGLPLAIRVWHHARAELDATFQVDTGEETEHLFDTETRLEEVDPQAFMEGLAAEWSTAETLWDRVLDAVDASMRRAQDDLDRDGLEQALDLLKEAGLPSTWAHDHPLHPEAQAVWQRLDARRRADPLEYLDHLEPLLELDRGILDRAEALAGVRPAIAKAWQALSESASADLDTRVRDPDRDPVRLEAAARRAEQAIEASLAQGTDAEGVLDGAHGLILALTKLGQLHRRIRTAVGEVEGVVHDARAELEGLDRDLEAQKAQIRELLARHEADALTAGWTELREASEDREQAAEALASATEALAERAHLEAVEAAREALRERQEASEDLSELDAILRTLEKARFEADAARSALTELRDKHAAEQNGFRSYGRQALDEGDALWEELRFDDWAGPGDWSARLAAVRQVQAAWRAGITEARSRYRRALAREASERAAAEAMRRDARRRATSSRSTASSSSRSSHARSSGYRTSRSSRSTRRSGGRRFSSGGRSAGRRW
jgi:hypothetical protein